MAEIIDKYYEKGPLSYLDMDDNIERLLPGPSEKERNESRLNHLITGEKRPVSHIDHETKAWAVSNVDIPLLMAAIRSSLKGGSAFRGAKAIDKALKYGGHGGDGFQRKMKPAQKMAREGLAEAGKNLKKAKKEAPKNLFERLFYNMNGGMNEEIDALRSAKADVKDINNAINIVSQKPARPIGDMIEESMNETALKTMLGTGVGEKTAKALNEKLRKAGEGYVKGIYGFDDRLEMGTPSKVMHFLKTMTGGDELDTDIWPMETIDNLIHMTNGDLGLWDTDQLDKLDDKEKVRFVMNMARGKYNTEDYDVKNALLRNYLKLTRSDEE